MKKNLILMTALFAGLMIVNDGFGGRDLVTALSASKSDTHNPMQVVESNNDMQRDEEQGVDNQTQLNECKDEVKHEELKEEQTVIQSDYEGYGIPMPFIESFPASPVTKEVNDNSENKMDAASAISPVELVKVLSQGVVTKEEEKKDSVSVESSEDLDGKDSNKIGGGVDILLSAEKDVVLTQGAEKEEKETPMDIAQNGDSGDQPSLKRSESGELSSSDKKKLRKNAPKTPRKSKKMRI